MLKYFEIQSNQIKTGLVNSYFDCNWFENPLSIFKILSDLQDVALKCVMGNRKISQMITGIKKIDNYDIWLFYSIEKVNIRWNLSTFYCNIRKIVSM